MNTTTNATHTWHQIMLRRTISPHRGTVIPPAELLEAVLDGNKHWLQSCPRSINLVLSTLFPSIHQDDTAHSAIECALWDLGYTPQRQSMGDLKWGWCEQGDV